MLRYSFFEADGSKVAIVYRGISAKKFVEFSNKYDKILFEEDYGIINKPILAIC